MQRLWPVVCVCAIACNFDSSGVSVDADPNAPDADPNAPDADPNAPDASPNIPIVDELRPNAFGDGTAVAFIADFNGKVYLGPDQLGNRLHRFTYDASGSVGIDMTFAGDSGHNNGSTPPYPGIGYAGCTDDVDCGPDNENARGFFASGTIAGDEWLILGGARIGGSIDYVYMTNDNATSVEFSFVNLTGLLGGSTEGLSDVFVTGDHVYLGFSDTGGAQPYLLDLLAAPTAPGFAPSEGTEVFDLEADAMPNMADDPNGDGNTIIDSVSRFQDRLYIANESGWVRTMDVTFPRPFNTNSEDYAGAPPSAGEFTSKTGLGTAKTGDIFPADRAVPYMAEYNGALYAARNTTSGPQLWRCSNGGNTCDSPDWDLIAANTAGDTELSQFDNDNNTAITLLGSTGGHLYVGFDNPVDGVVLYRTDAQVPDLASDFEGDQGCAAGTGCPGLGGNGFGVATHLQFLDSEVIDTGAGVFVYAVVGNGSDPLSLYRFAP